ncbi:MAG: GGDEF domain-containing protein [Lachnospiraceae bacterium]|nr:GGDEF domain-containing protein [Lachnospiraceae bacterium]
MKNYSVLHILNLYHIYKNMDKQEKKNFYQHKCDYYQFFVKIILVIASLASLAYLVSDYQLNGHVFKPTLIPRVSVLLPLIFYIFLEERAKSYKIKIFLNYLMLNLIVMTTIWSVYHLQIKTHFSEGATIMNFLFLVCCLSSSPCSGLLGYGAFFAEILLSHQWNHYENLDVILSLNIPCFGAIMLAHCLLGLAELDHYLTSGKLEQALITDPLTTVYNRHKMYRLVQDNQLIVSEFPVSLIMLDIDYFKKINDTHGHSVGDQALQYLGKTLMKEINESGTVIRFGGEEFVIILPGCPPEKACEKAEHLRKKIASSEKRPVNFTISAGVAEYNGNFKKSMKAADHALYQAKKSGRNQVFWNREFQIEMTG